MIPLRTIEEVNQKRKECFEAEKNTEGLTVHESNKRFWYLNDFINAIEYFTDTYNGERFFIENAINFVEQEIASTQGFLDGLKWLMEEPDKQYVYVVIKDKSVEVYGNEELAKLRAKAIDARYYKRTIHYNFSEMVALDESK